jgi:hypothetical protein
MLKKKPNYHQTIAFPLSREKNSRKFITSLKEIIIKMLGYTLIRKITNYFKIMEF